MLHSSCSKSLEEEERLSCEAREFQGTAQSIRKKSKEIVEEGLPILNGTLLKEGNCFSSKIKDLFFH